MVGVLKKHIVLILFGVMGISCFAQRINVGVSAGMLANAGTTTSVDEEPFYFLYYAPYSAQQDDQGYLLNPVLFNQVRLAKINGIRSNLNGTFKIGGSISYASKNGFKASFELGMYTARDLVYYSFQEMVVNSNDSILYLGYNNTLDLLDERIAVSRFVNSYSLSFLKEIKTKSSVNPFIMVGFTERVQLYASYNSQVKQKDPAEYSNEELAQYINVSNFQENLYKEMFNDGFNHYLNLGFGVNIYSLKLELNRHQSIGGNRTDYFIGQKFWEVKMSYDLISIPVFK